MITHQVQAFSFTPAALLGTHQNNYRPTYAMVCHRTLRLCGDVLRMTFLGWRLIHIQDGKTGQQHVRTATNLRRLNNQAIQRCPYATG